MRIYEILDEAQEILERTQEMLGDALIELAEDYVDDTSLLVTIVLDEDSDLVYIHTHNYTKYTNNYTSVKVVDFTNFSDDYFEKLVRELEYYA